MRNERSDSQPVIEMRTDHLPETCAPRSETAKMLIIALTTFLSGPAQASACQIVRRDAPQR